MSTTVLADLTLAPASWLRRVLCMVYESLIVGAIILTGGLLALVLPSDPQGVHGLPKVALQLWILGLIGAYFAVCWWRFGQTLAMKTWRLVVTTPDRSPLSSARAVKRLVLAALTLPVSILWALVDRDRQFLHDRLAGTHVWHIVRAEKTR